MSKYQRTMNYTFIIPGELTDLNTYINAERTNRYIAAKIKREETDRVATEAYAQKLEPVEFYPVFVNLRWYTKNERKDYDNVVFAKKFILDGLVKASVLKNDSRKFLLGGYDVVLTDKENPRVEVDFYTSKNSLEDYCFNLKQNDKTN